MSIDRIVQSVAGEMGQLAKLTASIDWAEGELSAKQIPTSAWIRALTVAILLAKELPNLDAPIPGADPEGFVWLTYERGSGRVAVALKSPGYVWTARTDGVERTHASARVEDLVHGLRAALGRVFV